MAVIEPLGIVLRLPGTLSSPDHRAGIRVEHGQGVEVPDGEQDLTRLEQGEPRRQRPAARPAAPSTVHRSRNAPPVLSLREEQRRTLHVPRRFGARPVSVQDLRGAPGRLPHRRAGIARLPGGAATRSPRIQRGVQAPVTPALRVPRRSSARTTAWPITSSASFPASRSSFAWGGSKRSARGRRCRWALLHSVASA